MIDRPGLSSRALQVAAVVFALVTGVGLPEAKGPRRRLQAGDAVRVAVTYREQPTAR